MPRLLALLGSAALVVVGCADEKLGPSVQRPADESAAGGPVGAPALVQWPAVVALPRGYAAGLATGVTGEGLVVGTAFRTRALPDLAWAATVDPATGVVAKPIPLDPLSPGRSATANGVSGNVIAGSAVDDKGTQQAVYWLYPDPTPHRIKVERLARMGLTAAAATAAGSETIVGWYGDGGSERAFRIEVGGALAAEVSLPFPGGAYGVSDDGRNIAGCYQMLVNGIRVEKVAYVRGDVSYDLSGNDPFLNQINLPESCAYDVDDGGALGGYLLYAVGSAWYLAAARATNISQLPGWIPVFAPSRRGTASDNFPSRVLGMGLKTVGWVDVLPSPDGWTQPQGRYGFSNGMLLPGLPGSTFSEAHGVSSKGACLIAGSSGGQPVVWGC